MEKKLTSYVRNNLFFVDCGDCGKWGAQSGTCFLFRYKKKFLMVTAKHALGTFDINNVKILLNPFAEDIDARHRAIAFSYSFCFNGDNGALDYDSDADDFCIFEVDEHEPEEELQPFFFEYISPNIRELGATSNMIIVGYPTCLQDMNFDDSSGEFEAKALYANSFRKEHIMDFSFTVNVSQHTCSSFDGFSGSPVFYTKPDNTYGVIGIVLRGTAESGIFHCLDIRMVEAAIIQMEKNKKLGIPPDSVTCSAK